MDRLKLLLLAVVTVTMTVCTAACSPIDLQEYDTITHENLTMAKARYVEDVQLASGRHLTDPPLTEEDFPIGKLTWTDYVDTLAALEQFESYEASKQPTDAERDADE